ncbi:hypothetical protein IWZ00DRAFT_118677 [Phyllosticta capitalensis]
MQTPCTRNHIIMSLSDAAASCLGLPYLFSSLGAPFDRYEHFRNPAMPIRGGWCTRATACSGQASRKAKQQNARSSAGTTTERDRRRLPCSPAARTDCHPCLLLLPPSPCLVVRARGACRPTSPSVNFISSQSISSQCPPVEECPSPGRLHLLTNPPVASSILQILPAPVAIQRALPLSPSSTVALPSSPKYPPYRFLFGSPG